MGPEQLCRLQTVRLRIVGPLTPCPTVHPEKTEKWGFKPTKMATMVPELAAEFKSNLVKEWKFREVLKTSFQKELAADIVKVKKDNKVIFCADKSNIFYRMENKKQKKLLRYKPPWIGWIWIQVQRAVIVHNCLGLCCSRPFGRGRGWRWGGRHRGVVPD